ncbi:hypothetical protein AB1Z10_004671 [Vibrio parahaemolyticus]
MKFSEERAKKTIGKLYSNPKNWKRNEFRKAYFTLTGQKEVMSEQTAKKILKALVNDEDRREKVEYVSALLLISGKWILPRAISPSRMVSQIKVKYSYGDLRSCTSSLPYRK